MLSKKEREKRAGDFTLSQNSCKPPMHLVHYTYGLKNMRELHLSTSPNDNVKSLINFVHIPSCTHCYKRIFFQKRAFYVFYLFVYVLFNYFYFFFCLFMNVFIYPFIYFVNYTGGIIFF